jgi:hypothetical protein
MDLARLASLAEIVNALAVTLTPLALIVTIRQGTGANKALAVDSLAAAIVAHYYLFSFFRLCESAWYQRQANILDARQWDGWEKMARKYYHSPGVHEAWWPNRRHAYSPAFQAFLADTAPPNEVGSLNDIFDYVPRKT